MDRQIKLAIAAIVIVIPLSSLAVYGTNSNLQTVIDNSKLQAVSSFYPLYEFSQNVGEDKVDVTLPVPAGVEPHDWEPTIKDVQRMLKSDLIIINGIGFENWVDNLDEADYQGVIVDTSNGISVKNSSKEHAIGDPHIWLNPVYAKTQVQNIANAFSNSDPDNQQYYQSNAAKYIKQLDQLDSKIRNELSDCNRDFVTFHDAFSYFADEYNLNQHAIIPSNTLYGEVTAKTLKDIITTSRQLNIKVIFSEEHVDARTSAIIADDIDGTVLVLSTVEVFSDELYISKMTENLEHLKEALCSK